MEQATEAIALYYRFGKTMEADHPPRLLDQMRNLMGSRWQMHSAHMHGAHNVSHL